MTSGSQVGPGTPGMSCIMEHWEKVFQPEGSAKTLKVQCTYRGSQMVGEKKVQIDYKFMNQEEN